MSQKASDKLADAAPAKGPGVCATCGGARRLHAPDGAPCVVTLSDGRTRQCTGYVPPARGTVLMGASRG
jgi:hypothetical protein